MGEIEAAAAGHQKLAARRRHAVVDRHGKAARAQDIGRHQAGWTGADDRDIDVFHGSRGALEPKSGSKPLDPFAALSNSRRASTIR